VTDQEKVKTEKGRIVCRFSCGAASAVATKLALAKYADREVVIHYSDTRSEHPDNERFIRECEGWFGKPVERLASEYYRDIWDVWEQNRIIAVGSSGFAPCTEELKRLPAEMRQKLGDLLIFGYTAEERNRFARIVKRHPGQLFEAPLIDGGLTKDDCFAILHRAGIGLPEMYRLGFRNNNCIGCPKGGMGYWNHIRKHFPKVFERMAKLERKLGHAILKDEKNNGRVFLDELEPDRGDAATEPNIDCSVMCFLAEQDIGEAA
jgi:3'-phosphoadenosine 5'-phosphosulfate sulfotransferase (PAPS reductase)/FAD synthetase